MTASEKQMAIYAVAGLAAYYFIFHKDPVTGLTPLDNLVKNTADQALQIPGDLFSGGVIGIGKSVGIPATDMTKCQADIAAGNTFQASLDCTASEFFNYLRS
jgi:hypothetical protein